MARECQEKNAKGLTMVAVGVNKSAEQYLILDERTRGELASGKYHDQRRGSFGNSVRGPAATGGAAAGGAAADTAAAGAGAAGPTAAGAGAAGAAEVRTSAPGAEPGPAAPGRTAAGTSIPGAPMGTRARGRAGPGARRAGLGPRRAAAAPGRPWTGSQERLALLYNEQGLRPAEIARKLGVSQYVVSQIILSSRNRGKL